MKTKKGKLKWRYKLSSLALLTWGKGSGRLLLSPVPSTCLSGPVLIPPSILASGPRTGPLICSCLGPSWVLSSVSLWACFPSDSRVCSPNTRQAASVWINRSPDLRLLVLGVTHTPEHLAVLTFPQCLWSQTIPVHVTMCFGSPS